VSEQSAIDSCDFIGLCSLHFLRYRLLCWFVYRAMRLFLVRQMSDLATTTRQPTTTTTTTTTMSSTRKSSLLKIWYTYRVAVDVVRDSLQILKGELSLCCAIRSVNSIDVLRRLRTKQYNIGLLIVFLQT